VEDISITEKMGIFAAKSVQKNTLTKTMNCIKRYGGLND